MSEGVVYLDGQGVKGFREREQRLADAVVPVVDVALGEGRNVGDAMAAVPFSFAVALLVIRIALTRVVFVEEDTVCHAEGVSEVKTGHWVSVQAQEILDRQHNLPKVKAVAKTTVSGFFFKFGTACNQEVGVDHVMDENADEIS